ncbi:hypothetical protein ACIHFD_25450 [Nonomuraea sp. NPDC051941]|uniref:hypothetical protein n=1 Tax=Nonomuraea sp. NPDC051941 TaxID=3364373 RepID=UPI0037C82C94
MISAVEMTLTGFEFALWGAAGSLAVDGLELITEIKKHGGFPWGKKNHPGVTPYIVSIFIRLGIGATLAAAFGLGGQVTGVVGALTVGIAAPLIMEKLGKAAASTVPTVQPGIALDAPQASNPSDEGGRR